MRPDSHSEFHDHNEHLDSHQDGGSPKPSMSQTQLSTPFEPHEKLYASEQVEESDPENMDEFLIRKRIAILGARTVGKTAVIMRCTEDRIISHYTPTFEDSHSWFTTVDGIAYEITFVDTSGQDNTTSFGLHYTIGVDGYIIMFSMSDANSFSIAKNINRKLLRILNVLEEKGTAEVPRILVGNQLDVAHQRQITFDMAQSFADDIQIPYMETSAYTSCNIPDIFNELLKIIDKNFRNSHIPKATLSSQPPTSEQSSPSPTSNPNPQPPTRSCNVQ